MKKLLLSAILMAFAVGMMAQSVSLPNPDPAWLKRFYVSSIPVEQNSGNAYLLLSYRPASTFKPKTYTDYVYFIDKGSLSNQCIEMTVSNAESLLGGISTDRGIALLYNSLNKKGDQAFFTIMNLDGSEKSVTLTHENTVTTSANPRYWPSYMTAKSPDGKLLATLMTVTGKDNQLENLFVVVVNDHGEFAWSGPITPEFNGKTFSLGNFTIDNSGVIYIPAYTCEMKGKNISDVNFMMIKTSESGTESFQDKVSFGVPQNFTAKILKNGNVAVAGYYTESMTNTSLKTNGFFFFKFDTRSEDITEIQHFGFSDNYVEKNAWVRFSTVLGNQQYSITAKDIFELENGSLALCGEHRLVKAIYDPNMKSYSYQMLTKNILVSTLLPNGEAKFTMVEKQQAAGMGSQPQERDWPSHNISYSAFAHHNDLYFMFTDDTKNIPYPGKDVVCTISGFKFKGDKWASVLMRLTPEQEITQRVLTHGDQLLRAVDFFDGEYLYTTGNNQQEFLFSKIPLQE